MEKGLQHLLGDDEGEAEPHDVVSPLVLVQLPQAQGRQGETDLRDLHYDEAVLFSNAVKSQFIFLPFVSSLSKNWKIKRATKFQRIVEEV